MLRVADHAEMTDTGRQRRDNEDSSFARAPLFVVADGMGGAQAGEVASRTAVEVFADGLPDGPGSVEERLAAMVAEANHRIHALAAADRERAGMGTTLTAAYLGEDDLAVAHVGDSRLYLLRDGRLEQRTDDHSLVGELVRRGQLSPEEAEEHPQRSIITRALGPEHEVAVDHYTLPVRDGDVVLVCSDGLTTMVHDPQIAEILLAAPSLQMAARRLIQAANDAGGRDNITVLLFRVEEVGGPGHRKAAAAAAGPDTEPHEPPSAQATAVGVAAPSTTEVRQAVADAEARAVARREPRAPRAAAGPPPKRRSKRSRQVRALVRYFAVLFGLLAILAIPAYFALSNVYFLGSTDDGLVGLYKGVPYELPGGFELYKENFESGVPVLSLPPRAKEAVTSHELRSFDDARALIRKVERGELDGR